VSTVKCPRLVMDRQCPTCPFRNSKQAWIEVRGLLIERALTEATPICHSTGTIVSPAKRLFKESRICRGARDLQLQVFCSAGVLSEPTDEAWERAQKALAI
jgi:hypothetical protein